MDLGIEARAACASTSPILLFFFWKSAASIMEPYEYALPWHSRIDATARKRVTRRATGLAKDLLEFHGSSGSLATVALHQAPRKVLH